MADYEDGKNVLNQRPEPGRPLRPARSVKNEPQSVNVNIDTNAIADAVIKAISNKMPAVISQGGQYTDQFDTSGSLDKLADAMTIPKESEGKIDGIGIIKETKKDEAETKRTIDLLSNLGD